MPLPGTDFDLIHYPDAPGAPAVSPIRYPWKLSLFYESTSVLKWHSGYRHVGGSPHLHRKELYGKSGVKIATRFRKRYEEGRLFPIYYQEAGQQWSLDPFIGEGALPVGFLSRRFNDPYGEGSDRDKAQAIVDRLGSYYRQEIVPIRVHSSIPGVSATVDFVYYPSEHEALWSMLKALLPAPSDCLQPLSVYREVLRVFPELRAWPIVARIV